MRVKNPDVFEAVESISDHFNRNINNRYLRPLFLHMTLERRTMDMVDDITDDPDRLRLQGLHYEELYERIMALAKFIYFARKDILPSIRRKLTYGGAVGNERILREMAINNFGSNLSVLADLVNDLFLKTVMADKEDHQTKSPEYMLLPELKELGDYLVPK
ncbi:MAG: hypothetical protein ACLFSE_06960 [Spirochaetia bacterium]